MINKMLREIIEGILAGGGIVKKDVMKITGSKIFRYNETPPPFAGYDKGIKDAEHTSFEELLLSPDAMRAIMGEEPACKIMGKTLTQKIAEKVECGLDIVECCECDKNDKPAYTYHALKACEIKLRSGIDEAVKYIYENMEKNDEGNA